MYVDDVAVDFPRLKILLAHGGRPLWMDTAFFLVRRHRNVFLDISGIPPKTLLKYFPRLEEIAQKTLFGTDWPGPGVPEIERNLREFRAITAKRICERTHFEQDGVADLAGRAVVRISQLPVAVEFPVSPISCKSSYEPVSRCL